MRAGPPTLRRIVFSALAALLIGMGAVSLITGFSDSFVVRLLQGAAVFGAGAVIVGGTVLLVMIRLAGWENPQSDDEFDAIVERTERLAATESWGEGFDEGDGDEGVVLDTEEDFGALVRSALDDLPLEFHRALEHVAIVVSEGGRRRRA